MQAKPTITATPQSTPIKSIEPPVPTVKPTPNIYQGLNTNYFYITFYGWPDNSPPGNGIAYPQNRNPQVLHNYASGVGTYIDPITFASDPDHIPVGKIYYVPKLNKYIIMEDYCEGCVDSWDTSEPHIDIWMESWGDFEEELIRCQRKWTEKHVMVITNPHPNLTVDETPLFNTDTGECNAS